MEVLQPRICFCGLFLSLSSFFPQTFLFLTEDIWISSLFILVIQRECCITISCETFVENYNREWEIDAGLNTLMPGSSLSPSNPFLSTHHSQCSDQISSTVAWPFSFSLRHCFAALLGASQRAMTQKADSRTRKTATWPTLWSGSLPASSTRCAQRAA